MTHDIILPIFSIFLGFFMAWGVGANDLANILSTSLGSKSITVRQAIAIAIIFELAGALWGSSNISETMRHGILDTQTLAATQRVLTLGMLSILIAGTAWINFASYYGLPVSITNAIVGSFVGFGALVMGIDSIHWFQITLIMGGWLFNPIIAAILAYLIFTIIQNTIFMGREPIVAAKRYFPSYLFLVGVILSVITVIKGLRHFAIQLHVMTEVITLSVLATLFAAIAYYSFQNIFSETKLSRRRQFVVIEKMFAKLMACTACAMVFAHGANDVAVAVGPLFLLETIWFQPENTAASLLPLYTIIFGVIGVISGLVFYGRKIIATVGSGITTLTPSRAFAATLSAATIMVIATSTGIPVSATQTLVGAVLGVGFARGIGALNLNIIRNIILSWVVTLPVVSLLTIVCYEVLQHILP